MNLALKLSVGINVRDLIYDDMSHVGK